MFIFKKWLKKYLDKIVLRLKMKLDFFEQKKAMGQLRKKGDAYRITHSRRPRGSQSGRVKRRDESFQAWADVLENFCRAFSPGPTDRPWVSEDKDYTTMAF